MLCIENSTDCIDPENNKKGLPWETFSIIDSNLF